MNVKKKGTAGEHEIVELFRKYHVRAYRNDQIFRGGEGNPDVYAEILDQPFHIEVKRVEKLNVSEAVNQAMRDVKPGWIPAVAHRKNREKWLVTVPLTELLDFLREKELI